MSHGAAIQCIQQKVRILSLVPAFSRDGNSHHQFCCMPHWLSIKQHTLRRIRENRSTLQLFPWPSLPFSFRHPCYWRVWVLCLLCPDPVAIPFTQPRTQRDCISLCNGWGCVFLYNGVDTQACSVRTSFHPQTALCHAIQVARDSTSSLSLLSFNSMSLYIPDTNSEESNCSLV